ncbi:MAG: SPOR domain-containing protein [Betaproteobacteria bacterium]|nr:SPOR domain-containing protein [Betaproteobacteria bacterium]
MDSTQRGKRGAWIWVFGCLILANGAFFGFSRLSGEDHARPARRSLNANRIVLLPAPPALPAPTSTPTPPPPKASTASACLQWGPFSGPDVAKAQTVLATLRLAAHATPLQTPHPIGYWVYLPPAASLAAAQGEVATLQAKGITQYEVLRPAGPWQYAVSLGVLSTQDRARQLLRQVRAQGVANAKMGQRMVESGPTRFLIAGASAVQAAALKRASQPFSGAVALPAPCTTPSSVGE